MAQNEAVTITCEHCGLPILVPRSVRDLGTKVRHDARDGGCGLMTRVR